MVGGGTGCLFTYGHTGSGKTHTIFGYGKDKGMYEFAALRLENILGNLKNNSCKIECRFSEVYNGYVYDLLEDRICCTVRTDSKGKVHIRGDTIMNEDGSWRIKVLKGMHARTSKEVVDIVKFGLKTRKVGNSGVHNQSSRSHAILELEIVTDEIINQRQLVEKLHSREALLGKWYHGLKLKTVVLKDTGFESVFRLRKAFDESQLEHKNAVDALSMLQSNSPRMVGGTIVFCDLAGSEYAGSMHGLTKTPKEQEEAREINLSLLALKQCIRDLGMGKQRVPFRNSKLTMILKQHLEKSKGGMTSVVVNVSPSLEHEAKTINALHYAELVG